MAGKIKIKLTTEQIITELNNGETMKNVAKLCNVSRARVYKILKQEGWTTRWVKIKK